MSEYLVSNGLGLVPKQSWKGIMIVLYYGEPYTISNNQNA
jgi:hypothetical protein